MKFIKVLATGSQFDPRDIILLNIEQIKYIDNFQVETISGRRHWLATPLTEEDIYKKIAPANDCFDAGDMAKYAIQGCTLEI